MRHNFYVENLHIMCGDKKNREVKDLESKICNMRM